MALTKFEKDKLAKLTYRKNEIQEEIERLNKKKEETKTSRDLSYLEGTYFKIKDQYIYAEKIKSDKYCTEIKGTVVYLSDCEIGTSFYIDEDNYKFEKDDIIPLTQEDFYKVLDKFTSRIKALSDPNSRVKKSYD